MSQKKLDYYMALPYPMTISWSQEDELFVARVPLLPGCVAHGSSREEALKALDRNREDWISVAIEDKRSIPEPADEDVTLPSGKWLQRVPKSLHKQLVDAATEEGSSLNQLVTVFLATCIGQRSAHRESELQAKQQISLLWSKTSVYTAPASMCLVLPETIHQEKEHWSHSAPFWPAEANVNLNSRGRKIGGYDYAAQEASTAKLYN